MLTVPVCPHRNLRMAGWSACCDGGDHEVSRDKETTVSCLCENGKKEGYILEKWEFYPFPKSVSTFLVLKPEHLKGAVPGVLCIPGWKDQRRIGW